MGYKFRSKLLRPFNNIEDASVQLSAVYSNFWNQEIVEVFQADHGLFRAFMDDLNGLLHEAEQGRFEQFEKLAKICLTMTVGTDPDFLRSLYAIDIGAFGVFLMRCMRVNNLATHSSSALVEFKKVFDAVGIRVVGDWDLCVKLASFEWTEFSDGTLTVAPPGGNRSS